MTDQLGQFGELYSRYYDLLYHDKNYEQEVDYIVNLLGIDQQPNLEIMDLGCGTGKHAALLCKKGYAVHGVDLSADMLREAKKRRKGIDSRLTFEQSDILDLDLDREFGVIISMFHVMSYQNSNESLVKAFDVAKKHLKQGGLFLFDFWYGPAVLSSKPTVKVKRLEDECLEITRIAEPEMDACNNIVKVNFDIFIKEKMSNNIVEKNEIHNMRYLFDKELEMICDNAGFRIEQKKEWLTDLLPNFDSWNAVWVVKKL